MTAAFLTGQGYLPDDTATETLGGTLAGTLRDGGLITLSGDLGAGKTTLCRGIIRACGHQGAARSPTYTLVEPYEHTRPPVMHFDLYRLAEPEELDFVGFRDYLLPGHLCLIEWPQKGRPLLPEPDLELALHLSPPGRQLTWRAADTTAGRKCDSTLQRFFLDIA